MSVHVIAEGGSVHDGSFGNASKLVELAKELGADSIKFQTHIPAAETTKDAPAPSYFKGEPRFEYFERTGFRETQWVALRELADKVGVEFLSSPFSIAAVDLLERVGIARYKVPSGEVTNLPLLKRIAETGKPVLLSSGMSTWAELDAAVETILARHGRLVVLQCTSAYPCPAEDVGLNVMLAMKERYRVDVGLSDHTITPYASLAAVALGATVIEKHLTFSRKMYGSDAKHSLEPHEFADMVRGIRAIATMAASPVDKDAMAARLGEMKRIFEKSVVTTRAIRAGDRIENGAVDCKKPGTGIPAARIDEVIGRRAARDLGPDTVLVEEDLLA